MCGLVGMMTTTVASDKQLDLLAGLLYVDQVRGKHATGLAKINPWRGSIDIIKKAVSAQVFLGMEETQEFLDKSRGRIYIGHNRYATHGDKSKHENAHPFQEGHITLVHNGGVDSWTMDGLSGYDDKDVVVDSHMVCRTIAEIGIEEAVKKLSGAFALVWWDSKEHTLNFIRNKERPLWMAELSDGSIYWASEREFLDFFVNRKKNALSYKVEPKELPENLHVFWKFSDKGVLENNKPTTKEIKFTRVPDPSPRQTNWSDHWYGGGSSNKSSSDYYSGYNTYDKRANDLMSFYKVGTKVNQRVVVKVTRIEEHSSNKARVNIYGEYEGVECILYFLEKKDFNDAKYISAVITNCHDRKQVYQGTEWKEPLITLRADGARVENVQLSVVKVPTTIGRVFPLKVHGHTFNTPEEFKAFACQGCALCGKVPVSSDSRNKEMSVYGTSEFNGMLKDCEFICGECNMEGNK